MRELEVVGEVPSLCDPGSIFMSYYQTCLDCIQEIGDNITTQSELRKNAIIDFSRAIAFCGAGSQNKDLSASYRSAVSVLSSLTAEAAARSITLTQTSTTDFKQGPTIRIITSTFSMLP